jgi:hypothetical protein
VTGTEIAVDEAHTLIGAGSALGAPADDDALTGD